MTTSDFFASTNEPGPTKTPDSGLLVTNHLNLMYMLATGLLMPPAGFGDKYYHDTLSDFPGWIPLFIDKVPKRAIESSTSDAGHLMPSIVEVGLSGLSGPLMAMDDDGFREIRFPEQIQGIERAILVPAPLPTSRIASIVFQSIDDRRACEAGAADLGNVTLTDFKRRSSKPLFAKAANAPWPPGAGPGERTAPLQLPLATGGVMAMLLLFANLGDQAVWACRLAFDPDNDTPPPADPHPILAGLGTWIREGSSASLPAPAKFDAVRQDRASLQNASQARLFWEAVERLVQWRDAGCAGNSGNSASTGNAESAEDMLIHHLAEAATNLDPRLQTGVRKLRDTLDSLSGFADATASELLERHDTPLAHAMTLFFLRGDCADLFDYASDRVTEPDWLAAAILFGVRDGWLKLPLRLRGGRALSDAVSHRMAHLSHRVAGTGLDLGEAPPRIRPLRELFGDGSAWRSREKSAALTLARVRKWGCVHTRIKLGAGQYRLVVKGESTHIEVPGEPRISPEVDQDRFFELLADARLDSATEAKVRKELGG